MHNCRNRYKNSFVREKRWKSSLKTEKEERLFLKFYTFKKTRSNNALTYDMPERIAD